MILMTLYLELINSFFGFFLNNFLTVFYSCFHLFCVAGCLVAPAQTCMERIPVKNEEILELKERFILSSLRVHHKALAKIFLNMQQIWEIKQLKT